MTSISDAIPSLTNGESVAEGSEEQAEGSEGSGGMLDEMSVSTAIPRRKY
jgi:hypothetical protein